MVKRTLPRHGLQQTVICWRLSLLRCRILTISIYESNIKELAKQRMPSRLCVNTAHVELSLLGGSDIFAQAYAEDVVVSLAGKFTLVLSDRIQTACRLILG